jgi:hypothetical protein
LSERLTKQEIRLIKSLANRSRRRLLSRRPHSPVLVLTATELFADIHGLHDAWKQKGGMHGELALKHHLLWDLTNLSDLTQQLYLGMPPQDEWIKSQWDQRYERRARKKEKKSQ